MIAVLFIAFGFVALLLWIVSSTNKRSALDQWAAENQYTLLNVERRTFFKGPYFLSGKDKNVYYVTVQSDNGTRNAYVRIGNFFPGLPYRIDVSWD